MLFLGQRYSAADLRECGVAWKVVEDADLQIEAQTVAEHLAGLPILSVRAMKRVLNQTTAGALRQALDLETEATIAGFLDPETTRLLKAF
jgi:enoyl-CoA hydratase/carnithine racemase